jgi:P-type Ca2+ transporter type 2C
VRLKAGQGTAPGQNPGPRTSPSSWKDNRVTTPATRSDSRQPKGPRGGTPRKRHDTRAWHALPEKEVRDLLRTDLDGLSESEIVERRTEFGENALPAPKPPSLPKVVLHQFKSPLIYILLIAGVLALALGDLKDTVFIFAVVVLNATIGTLQEWRTEQKTHALQSLLKIHARVMRGGHLVTVSAEELVPGDIVVVESGDKVPADLRLVNINTLSIDESFLTGESLPVEKALGELADEVPVSDRANMAFAGSTVTSGRGTGMTVATGSNTEVGRIAVSLVTTESAKPPLLIRMEKFARHISIVVLAVTMLLGGWLISMGHPLHEVFLLMVAIAVSAIPEGLPVAMTVALSIATARMAERNVIARRLMAVESLGSCTLIASDKTGTLTVNQQTVKLVWLPDGTRLKVEGEGYNDSGYVLNEEGSPLGDALQSAVTEIALAGVLCNDASLRMKEEKWLHSGDAMDVALLSFALKLGIDPDAERRGRKVLGEIPFESERRYAAKAYETAQGPLVVIKGAVETVLPLCSSTAIPEDGMPLDIQRTLETAEHLAENGYRVLAIASGVVELANRPGTLDEDDLGDLTLLGLVGFIDPLRPRAALAVAEAQKAGVRVIMITGDHPATALAISRELGIAEEIEDVVTGSELELVDGLRTPAWNDRVREAHVFARVTPRQKLDIVDALVGFGEFVAVTGDGVNDAAALRRANIGVAMGSGTDIAKDASLITIVDDDFSSIVAGIEEGRFAYANVRKVTLLLISTGFALLLLLVTSIFLGLTAPLVAVQILWLNLVTNGIQDVALAFERGEQGVMRLPPRRPAEGIFNRKMLEQVLISGGTMGLVCLGAWVLLTNGDVPEQTARTLVFTLLVLMQSYHVLNCRSEYRSAFKVPFRNNRVLLLGMLVAFGIHVAAVSIPVMQSLLRVTSLRLVEWAALAALASVVIIVMEVYKRVKRDDPHP